MNELDKMLEAPSEMALPPLVRYCKSRKAAGDRIEVELYRPDTAGGLSRTELVSHRWEQEKEQEPLQVEWDDGVNAGLVDLGIRAIDLHTNSPDRSRSYQECRELIANEIGGRAVELRDKLRYKADEIKAVMTKALALYLDERFSVRSRRSFGLLEG